MSSDEPDPPATCDAARTIAKPMRATAEIARPCLTSSFHQGLSMSLSIARNPGSHKA